MSLPQAIQDYIKGNKLSEEAILARKKNCLLCREIKKTIGFKKKFPYIGWQHKCGVCGCFLDGVLGKWAAPREQCPLKKW